MIAKINQKTRTVVCYHNSLTANPEAIEKRFAAKFSVGASFAPIYHASGFAFPAWPILTAQSPRLFQLFDWGLVPHWVQNEAQAQEMRGNTLNAKVETLAEKPSFKYALQNSQRCIVPSTGFFEWHSAHKTKFPYCIQLKQFPIFALAGLWETWQDAAANKTWHTFSVVTTEANPLMAQIHNSKRRMPLILRPDTERMWLQPSLNKKEWQELAKPLDENLMEAFTVGRLIGNPKANTNVSEVAKPVFYPELSQQQLGLF